MTASNLNSVVHLFHNYFNSVFTNSDFVLSFLDKLPSPSTQLSYIEFDSNDVFEALMSLNTSKACGCDKISSHFLKLCATSLLTPITNLLSLCMTKCTLPREWTVHKICPIFKVEMFMLLRTTGQSRYYASLLRFWNQLFIIKSLTLFVLLFPAHNMVSFKVNPVNLKFLTLTLRSSVHLIKAHLVTSFS